MMLRGLFAVWLALSAALGAFAQDPAQEPPADAEKLTTLHVYMDLIQVPVLVLDSEMDRLRPIAPAKFEVSLDSGPAFRPRHVRQEGDDPITLAILLDLNNDAFPLLSRMPGALAALVPGSLRPQDHVTLYAMHCGLTRTLQDVPVNSLVLQAGAENAMKAWLEHRKEKPAKVCTKRVQLWDAMQYAVKQLGTLPGRRVLLVASDGVDHGSVTKWDDVKQIAQSNGVAVFGYRENRNGAVGVRSSGRMSVTLVPSPVEDPFNYICQLSGGAVLPADVDFIKKQLQRFVVLVRERYILEFSRARNETPGLHDIKVTVQNSNDYIRSAGVLVLLSSNNGDDATTIPRDDSDAPELGKRKVLTPLRTPQ